MEQLRDRIAVITGVASGVGLGLAREFAHCGMSVVLDDLAGERLDRAADELARGGDDIHAQPVDVTDAVSIEQLAVSAEARYGAVDLVCLNAGVLGPTNIPLWEIDDADWRTVFDVNFFGVLHGIREFVPRLLTRPAAHIAVTASMAGLVTGDGEGPYVTSKHALVALGEILAHQLANTNVGVSILCPWWIRTDILSTTKNRGTLTGAPLEAHQALRDKGLEPDEFARRVAEAVLTDELYLHTEPDLVRDAFGTRVAQILANC
jgi:NAD(P)-dependent dehydrogenase (short-subunit alcohol dehydrogenase family)